MFVEIAQIEIDPERAAEFAAAVASAEPHFRAAKGFKSFALMRSVERPGRYRLMIGWETVDNHMVDFRNSDGFAAWRAAAGPFFVQPPEVEHVYDAFAANS